MYLCVLCSEETHISKMKGANDYQNVESVYITAVHGRSKSVDTSQTTSQVTSDQQASHERSKSQDKGQKNDR